MPEDTAHYADLDSFLNSSNSSRAAEMSAREERSPADRKYREYIEDILENGTEGGDRTGVGTRKVAGQQLRFDLSEGFPLIGMRPIWAFGAFREMMWFVRGRTNIWHLLQDGVGIWTANAYKNYKESVSGSPAGGGLIPESEFAAMIRKSDQPKGSYNFAGMWGEMGEIYGERWRNADGFDQIENLLQQLGENPQSRRLKVDAWKPSYHMKGAPDTDLAEPPPCHTGFQVVTEEMRMYDRFLWAADQGYNVDEESKNGAEVLDALGVPRRRLHLIWSQRSVDSMLGLPFNIAGYGLLAHMLADQANMAVGDLVFQGGDCHIYRNHIDAAHDLIRRSPPTSQPQIELPEAPVIEDYTAEDVEVTGYDPNPHLDQDLEMCA